MLKIWKQLFSFIIPKYYFQGISEADKAEFIF